MRRSIKIGGVVVVALVVLAAGAFAVGVLGVPSVTGVENSFGPVNDTNTIIETELSVNNPNPIGIRLGGVSVDYNVSMNGVDIASGEKDGVGIGTGNSTVNLTTAMDNDQIPAWWYTHIRNGESTTLTIDATASSSTLGRSANFGRERGVETDIVSQFDSNETRPVNASQPLLSNPVLYVNSTRGSWDQSNLTRQQTPLDLDFTVYNPKSIPYTVSKIGYNVTMNGIPVGAGESDKGYVIEPGTTETIRANAAIRNENLDEWWVSHLERNQMTDLYIDFYVVVEVQGEDIKIDLDSIDYEKQIETDIFGNKPVGDGATESQNQTDTTTDEGVISETTDGGLLDETGTTDGATDDGSTATDTSTDAGGVVDGETATETATTTDDGVL